MGRRAGPQLPLASTGFLYGGEHPIETCILRDNYLLGCIEKWVSKDWPWASTCPCTPLGINNHVRSHFIMKHKSDVICVRSYNSNQALQNRLDGQAYGRNPFWKLGNGEVGEGWELKKIGTVTADWRIHSPASLPTSDIPGLVPVCYGPRLTITVIDLWKLIPGCWC